MSADAYHITAPHPDGRAKNVIKLFERCRVLPTDVDGVNMPYFSLGD
jgi:3-oxoacyl-(acyl-carrier-protein) synthase